ncbi:MAG: lipase family protein [Clostridia bacterium]|nr:lipase family protein [Clostridia bacterium]
MENSDPLLSLFLRCLNAHYIHTPKGGDYALEVDNAAEHVYLLFEWSDGREDWHNNLTFFARTANPDAPPKERWYCHRGFWKVWNAMKKQVIQEITEIDRQIRIRKITCIGYSHGAAISLLATEEITRCFPHIVHIEGYGFGSPRVVWGTLPKSVNDRCSCFRTIRNVPDVITHLPPAILGFRHVGLETIGTKGKYSPIKAHTPQAYTKELGSLRHTQSRFIYGKKKY